MSGLVKSQFTTVETFAVCQHAQYPSWIYLLVTGNLAFISPVSLYCPFTTSQPPHINAFLIYYKLKYSKISNHLLYFLFLCK